MVDDEEQIRQVTKLALEENGYRILEAKNGPEAVTVFARHADAINVVLSDIMLPFMDGADVIRAMKRIRPNALIIAASGQDDQQVLARLKSLGVAAFLSKPYGIAKLLSTVSEVCSRASGAGVAGR